jgi:Flp pilus assembly pilin Flp
MKKASVNRGQSVVEYVVLLALISIVAVTIVAGIGQRSRARVALANQALEEASVAASTPPAAAAKPGKPAKNGKVKPGNNGDNGHHGEGNSGDNGHHGDGNSGQPKRGSLF